VTREEREETESALSALEKLNRTIDEAIRSNDVTTIPDLIGKRGKAVNRLMQAHKSAPVDADRAESLLREDKRLSNELSTLKKSMGDELSLSRRHAHASRMYTKHEQ
jgi:hypothetical protein